MKLVTKFFLPVFLGISLSACGMSAQEQFYSDVNKWMINAVSCNYANGCDEDMPRAVSSPELVAQMIEDAKVGDAQAQLSTFIMWWRQIDGVENLLSPEEAYGFVQAAAKTDITADIILAYAGEGTDEIQGYKGFDFEAEDYEEKLRPYAESGNALAQLEMIEYAEQIEDNELAEKEELYWLEKLEKSR